TVTLNTATGAYTVTQNAPIHHDLLPAGENNQAFTLTYRVTDGDGDTVDGTLGINVDDDTPSGLTPDALNVDNIGIAGTSDQITAALNFSVGADGVGSVVFNVPGVPVGVTSGITVAVTDLDGHLLFLGTQQLYLYYGGAGGTDTTILVAKTLTGTVGFTIDINPLTGTYIFNPEGVISNGTAVTATNLTGVGGANVPFKLLIDIGGTNPTGQDVAMTTANGATINSDADDIGISQAQTFETGEAIRFDLVNGLKLDAASGFAYDGTHNETVRWKQTIQMTGNESQRANIVVSAIVADSDNTFFGDSAGETFINLSTANIKIYDATGTLIPTANYGALGINLTDQGNSILIEGLRDDWKYEIVTDDSHKFSAVQVEAATGTDNFSLGFFTYGVDNPGTPIALSYDIVGTDVDGDSTTGTIDITLHPHVVSAPAGVAGEPINLGLTAPSAEDGALVTVAIADVPSGWTLNGGTLLDDGTWTVQTTAPRSLAITSPAAFAGAMLLNVTATWAQVDGSTAKITIADNVEVFAPDAPIFAWSGDDHLTGSSGDDLFVFAQPIGHDVIYNFDAAHDQVDLIAFAGMTSYADVQANLANDASGQAVLTLGDGMTITFDGVDAAALGASNFAFNQEPVTNNPDTMVVSDGAMLPLGGIVNNTGTIALDSDGAETKLELIQHGITLQGGGQFTLSDSGGNVILGTDPSVTLTNVDNTISGAGQLGGGQMTLVNHGTIVATGSNALIIDTGANAVINSGTLEAVGSGGLVIHADVENSGLLWANGGNLTVIGDVTGDGSAKIDGIATMEFGAAVNQDITFDVSAAGTVKLDDADAFAGVIAGFDGNDQFDLSDVDFGAGLSLTYTANQGGTGGTLTVSDGTDTANIHLVGPYSAGGFQTAADIGTGTLVTYMPSEGVGKNVVVGGVGTDDILSGGAGADTFQFAPSFGHDTIVNFEPGVDKIDFDQAIFATVDDILAHTQQVGSDTVITVDQASSVTLTNVDMSTLSASDFIHH
ncbi:MAG TPA: hypothetical protein VFC01_35380, partial [Mycobacterium sp.]|nr:hypothetical protein [Mycobacterium sp.]